MLFFELLTSSFLFFSFVFVVVVVVFFNDTAYILGYPHSSYDVPIFSGSL